MAPLLPGRLPMTLGYRLVPAVCCQQSGINIAFLSSLASCYRWPYPRGKEEQGALRRSRSQCSMGNGKKCSAGAVPVRSYMPESWWR